MKKIISAIVLIALCAAVAFTLCYRVYQLDYQSFKNYPVRGVDVSSYQGDIDWDTLSRQNIRFVFIKATEGSTHTDPNFSRNFKAALGTSLRVGAYHFFSYDSSGSTQADNFIAAVPKTENMLPPVVDVEFYGDKQKHLPDKAATQLELSDLLSKLEAYYGVKPIIYAAGDTYKKYIAGAFDSYDIWIRSTYLKPILGDGRAWTFWQYTGRAKLDGYSGAEEHIDMNVFNGTAEDFEKYPG
jgi:lysozyme